MTNLINEIKSLGIIVTRDDLVIGAGGAMVLMGLRSETQDLDIEVTKELWNKLHTADPSRDVVLSESLTIWKATSVADIHIGDWKSRDFSVAKGSTVYGPDGYRYSYINAYGGGDWERDEWLTCSSIPAILRLKRRLNRDKDQNDIGVLKGALANRIVNPKQGVKAAREANHKRTIELQIAKMEKDYGHHAASKSKYQELQAQLAKIK